METTPARQGNLGDAPSSARLRRGVILFGVAILLGTAGLEIRASRLALSCLLIPFFLGSNGISMGLYRTCTRLAVGGLRDLGCGSEKITSRLELRAVRMRAFRVSGASLVMALLATGLLIFAPR